MLFHDYIYYINGCVNNLKSRCIIYIKDIVYDFLVYEDNEYIEKYNTSNITSTVSKNKLFVNTNTVINSCINLFIYIMLKSIFTAFKWSFKIKKFFKKKLKNDIKIVEKKEYGTFEINNVVIVHNNTCSTLNYILPVQVKEKVKKTKLDYLINDTIKDIYNIEENKKKILHVSLVNDNNDILCEITSDLQEFKYYFDKTDQHNTCLLYWKDIVCIIENKYNRKLDIPNTYVYIILNDEHLSEKTILLGSILNDNVNF